MNLAAKITTNTMWQGASKIIALILNLWVAKILLNYFTPSQMGQYTAVISVSQLFIFIVDLGLIHVLLSELGKCKNRKEESSIISNAFSLKIAVSSIYLVVTLAASILISEFSDLERMALLIVNFSFIFISLSSVFTTLYQKHLRTKLVAFADIVGKILIFVITYLFVLNQENLVYIVSALAIGNLFSVFILFISSRKLIDLHAVYHPEIWKKFLKIAWPVMLASFFSFIYYKSDTLIMKQLRDDSELGWYGSVYRILEVLVSFGLIFSGLIIPQLAKAWQNKDIKWMQKVFKKVSTFLIMIAMPIILGGQILAEPIITFFASDDYMPAIGLFKILIIAAGFILLAPFLLQLSIVLGQQKRILLPKLAIALGAVILYFMLIPFFGAVAAAWITVISEGINIIILFLICRNKVDLKIDFKNIFKIIISSVIMYIAMMYMANYTNNLILLLITGAIIYCLLILILSVIKIKEVKQVMGISIVLLIILLPLKINAETDYPKLASYYLDSVVSDEEVEYLSGHDLIILTMEAQDWSKSGIAAIRDANPDIEILAYVPSQSFNAKDLSDIREKLQNRIDDSWYLRDAAGNKISRWPNVDDIDITEAGWRQALIEFVNEDILPAKCGDYKCWDGVFYDMVDKEISWLNNGDIDLDGNGEADNKTSMNKAWRNAYKKMMKRSRSVFGKKTIIVVNGASTSSYQKYINGRMYEHFPQTWGVGDANWTSILDDYDTVKKLNDKPKAIIIASDGSETDYQEMRYGLASALLGSSYYTYDTGPEDHHNMWWYDEYEASLGDAISSPYNTLDTNHPSKIQEGVWRRNFENGIVIVNSTDSKRKINLEKGYDKISGSQDTSVNNGEYVGSVTLNAKDGIILLGKIQTIDYASFKNGTQAIAYNQSGKKKRNSFFPYDANYPGSVQIVKLPDKNRVITADETYVKIYKGSKLLYKFAPYGEGFKGGVNIAVDKLYKKDKKYYIVTGTETYGPHVRIYNMKGNLVDPGCFPYAEEFRGGVFVAIGDVDKKNPGKEIIVSAGLDGGPHVRMLNSKCELINPGFMAYDPSLRMGINVAAGDVDGDGIDEIVTGTGEGAGPQVKVFNKNGKLLNSFFAFSKSDRNGVRVSVSDIEGDSKEEIIATSFGIYNY